MEDKLVELPHAFRYRLRLSSRRMENKLVELPHAFRYSLWLSSQRMEDKLVELPHAFRYSLRLSFCARRRAKDMLTRVQNTSGEYRKISFAFIKFCFLLFSYDSEAVFTYVNAKGEKYDIIAPRSEW
jgi:hypothetical protein